MLEELPKYIDARRVAEHTGAISGVVESRRLKRIGAPFAAVQPVMVNLDIKVEEPKGLHVTGQITTELKATCQRCLNEMDVGVTKQVDVVLVDSSDRRPPPVAREDDVLPIDQGRIDIDQFVEDEVILGCPMIPFHDDIQCHVTSNEPSPSGAKRKRAFAGLDELLASAKINETPNE